MGIQRTRGEIPDQLKAAGRLGSRHVATLMSLTVNGPATVSELAARLQITLNHASLVVRELNRAGLVDRREDDADHRRVIVSIAPSAQQLLQAMVARGSRPFEDFLATLSTTDADKFIGHLSSLIEHLTPAGSDVDAQSPPEPAASSNRRKARRSSQNS
jgi:DNA-binding MarR family transcriptional regulator